MGAQLARDLGWHDVTNWEIRREVEGDEAAIEALVTLGFGPGRFAKTAYRLREGVKPDARLSFVAVDPGAGVLLGSVRFWPITIASTASLLLGPLAVRPDLRGQGIGIGLMQTGIAEAGALGYDSIVLVGDEPYYARVGFAKIPLGRIRFPGPVDSNRILGLALKEGALDALEGEVKRARVDIAVAAQAAALG
jgi:predicted N-acetyltransferase YhbS